MLQWHQNQQELDFEFYSPLYDEVNYLRHFLPNPDMDIRLFVYDGSRNAMVYRYPERADIYIERSLFRGVEDENGRPTVPALTMEELAAVIGHEVGHIAINDLSVEEHRREIASELNAFDLLIYTVSGEIDREAARRNQQDELEVDAWGAEYGRYGDFLIPALDKIADISRERWELIPEEDRTHPHNDIRASRLSEDPIGTFLERSDGNKSNMRKVSLDGCEDGLCNVTTDGQEYDEHGHKAAPISPTTARGNGADLPDH